VECKQKLGTSTELKNTLQEQDTLKFTKFLGLTWCGHIERMQNQRMSEHVAISTTEGIKRRGRSCKRWRDEVKENLKVIGIKNGQAIVKDHQE
jgi:hypothetical protein